MGEKTRAKVLHFAILVTAIVMGVYHIIFMVTPLWGYSRHNIRHVTFALAVVILGLAVQTGRLKRWLLLRMLIVSTASLVYILSNAVRLELQAILFLSDLDFVIGAVIIAIVIIVTWLKWGWILATVVIVAVLYFFFGSHVPGALELQPCLQII